MAERPGKHDDQTLLLADVGRKALAQVEALTTQLLEPNIGRERAKEVAQLLATGVWTHDHPLMASTLEQLGLPVRRGVPAEERALMDLYPQPRGRETSVEYHPAGPKAPRFPGRVGNGQSRRLPS